MAFSPDRLDLELKGWVLRSPPLPYSVCVAGFQQEAERMLKQGDVREFTNTTVNKQRPSARKPTNRVVFGATDMMPSPGLTGQGEGAGWNPDWHRQGTVACPEGHRPFTTTWQEGSGEIKAQSLFPPPPLSSQCLPLAEPREKPERGPCCRPMAQSAEKGAGWRREENGLGRQTKGTQHRDHGDSRVEVICLFPLARRMGKVPKTRFVSCTLEHMPYTGFN